MEYTATCAIALSITALLCVLRAFSTTRLDRNPPGPKPLPILGNVFDFPQDKPWETFAKWKEQYGDIVYINSLGLRMVFLNSMRTCSELLDKRSAKYSGRPRFVMLCELIGFDYTFNLMDYSPRWRKHRRLFHQYFNENEVIKYKPTQEHYVHLFLRRLLADPENFFSHVRLMFGETILDVVYDIKADDNNNTFIQNAEKAIAVNLEAIIPGRFVADAFPILKYVPSWFPGAEFKRLASKWRKVANDLKDLPFAYAKKKMEAGSAGPSVLASMLERCSEESSEMVAGTEETPEEVAKACASLAYLAGADTTLSTIQTFFMVMANNQEVQRTAQKELDSLFSDTPNRLPSHADKAHLPFVAAIAKEMLRYHNVLPIGAPHLLTEDDEYDGYHLRKGTVIFPNVWHVLRDPKVYPEPLSFNPRRWLTDTADGLKLNPKVPDPDLTFGSGRRICPGRHFASNSLFVTIANVLACFDIRPLDANGQPTDRVDEVFTSGLLIYPVSYKVSITPRSNSWTRLIRESDM